MDPADSQRPLEVRVAYSPWPQTIEQVDLRLAPASTVRDALLHSGLPQRHGLPLDGLEVGVWGRTCALDTALRHQDRVEIYRPLRVDPKEARRQRYKGQGRSPASRAAPA